VPRAFLLVALAIAAAFNVALALALIWRPDEMRYGEAILYDHAARLLRGEALYQPLDGPPYTIANYTPIYYVVAAGLRWLSGPGFAAGRLVSLCSALIVAGLTAWLVWRRTQSRWATAVGGLLFVALGIGGILPWSAAYKEDLLGLAFVLASIVSLDRAEGSIGIATAAIFASAALLTKQSLAGPAIFGTLWLLACRPKAAPLYAGTIALLTLGTALILEASTGAFFANIIGSNVRPPFSPFLFQHNLRELLTFQLLPIVIAGVSLWGMRIHRDLLVMSWLGSLIPLAPLGVFGADANYWLHFAAATAMLAALGLWRYRAQRLASLATVLLGAQALIATASVASWHLARPGFLATPRAAQAAMTPLIQRVTETEGTVLADPLDVVALANRPIFIEPTDYAVRERDGSWDPSPIVELLCRKQVPLVILGYALDDVGERWPHAIISAMQQTLVLEDIAPLANRARYVYVPDPDASC
jgi:hypothetical protein